MLRTEQIGFAGAAPELRYTPSGKAVATVGIATTKRWKDSESGEKKERTAWVNWEVWGESAENLAKLVNKGSAVFIEGTIQNDKWVDDKSGETKYRDRFIGKFWKLLDRKDADESAAGNGGEPQGDDIPQ